MTEAIMFPSEEWIQALSDRLNDSPDYKIAAAKWEGSLGYVVEPDKGSTDKQRISFMDAYHGEIRESCELETIEERAIDFILRANFATWKSIIKSEIEPIRAVMTGKIKVTGNRLKLLKNVGAAKVMMECMKSIPTRFEDE